MGARRSSRAGLPPLVLVADDIEDNRLIYTEYLRFKGMRVAEARNGEEAIARARAFHPAVVVMDLTMPGVDGWQATRAIKADASLRDTCIIVITGHGEPDARNRALDDGADAFVLKPCAPDDLSCLVQASCNDARKTRRR